jgi:hypothetical protein
MHWYEPAALAALENIPHARNKKSRVMLAQAGISCSK